MPKRKFPKFIYFLVCFLLIFEQSGFAQIAGELDISGHLALIRNSLIQDKFRPLHLRSLQYLSQNNSFKLLLDKGDQFRGQVTGDRGQKNAVIARPAEQAEAISTTARQLMSYFFIGLTLPNSSFWVNLRPDAEDNIIDDYLAKTDVGRILLEADLQLKKDTASFTSPQTPEGRDYWNKLYAKAGELFGSENITIPTLTRPWIVPGEIIIRETQGALNQGLSPCPADGRAEGTVPAAPSAYIYKATLKVMLEEDYLKKAENRGQMTNYTFKDPQLKALNEYSTQLIRELIIPKLTKDVNTSKRYAPLRQVYYSLILAQWFKARYRGQGTGYRGQKTEDRGQKNTVIASEPQASEAISSRIDSCNLTNLISKQPWSKTTYFQAYQKSFKDGEYNIKEPAYTPTGQVIRSYFSGGIIFNIPMPVASSGIAAKMVKGPTEVTTILGDEHISFPVTSNDIGVLVDTDLSKPKVVITGEAYLSSGSPADRSPSGASSSDKLSVASPVQDQFASSAINEKKSGKDGIVSNLTNPAISPLGQGQKERIEDGKGSLKGKIYRNVVGLILSVAIVALPSFIHADTSRNIDPEPINKLVKTIKESKVPERFFSDNVFWKLLDKIYSFDDALGKELRNELNRYVNFIKQARQRIMVFPNDSDLLPLFPAIIIALSDAHNRAYNSLSERGLEDILSVFDESPKAEKLLQQAYELLAKENPVAAIKSYDIVKKHLPDPELSLKAIVESVAQNDPAAMFGLCDFLRGRLPGAELFLSQLAWKWAQEDPLGALRSFDYYKHLINAEDFLQQTYETTIKLISQSSGADEFLSGLLNENADLRDYFLRFLDKTVEKFAQPASIKPEDFNTVIFALQLKDTPQTIEVKSRLVKIISDFAIETNNPEMRILYLFSILNGMERMDSDTRDFLNRQYPEIMGRLEFLKPNESLPYKEIFGPKNPDKQFNIRAYIPLHPHFYKEMFVNALGLTQEGEGDRVTFSGMLNGKKVTIYLDSSGEPKDYQVEIFQDMGNPNIHMLLYGGHTGMGAALRFALDRAPQIDHFESGTKIIGILSCDNAKVYAGEVRRRYPYSQGIYFVGETNTGEIVTVLKEMILGITREETWPQIDDKVKEIDPTIKLLLPHKSRAGFLRQGYYIPVSGVMLLTENDVFNFDPAYIDLSNIVSAKAEEVIQKALYFFHWNSALKAISEDIEAGGFAQPLADEQGVFLIAKKKGEDGRDRYVVTLNVGYRNSSKAALAMMLLYELNEYISKAVLNKDGEISVFDKLRGLQLAAEFVTTHHKEHLFPGFLNKYGYLPENVPLELLQKTLDTNDNATRAKALNELLKKMDHPQPMEEKELKSQGLLSYNIESGLRQIQIARNYEINGGGYNFSGSSAFPAQEKPVSSPVGEINKTEGWSFDKGRLVFSDGTAIYNQHTRRAQLRISLEPLDLSKINADEDLEWVRALIIQWQQEQPIKEAEKKKEAPSKETGRVDKIEKAPSLISVFKARTTIFSKIVNLALVGSLLFASFGWFIPRFIEKSEAALKRSYSGTRDISELIKMADEGDRWGVNILSFLAEKEGNTAARDGIRKVNPTAIAKKIEEYEEDRNSSVEDDSPVNLIGTLDLLIEGKNISAMDALIDLISKGNKYAIDGLKKLSGRIVISLRVAHLERGISGNELEELLMQKTFNNPYMLYASFTSRENFSDLAKIIFKKLQLHAEKEKVNLHSFLKKIDPSKNFYGDFILQTANFNMLSNLLASPEALYEIMDYLFKASSIETIKSYSLRFALFTENILNDSKFKYQRQFQDYLLALYYQSKGLYRRMLASLLVVYKNKFSLLKESEISKIAQEEKISYADIPINYNKLLKDSWLNVDMVFADGDAVKDHFQATLDLFQGRNPSFPHITGYRVISSTKQETLLEKGKIRIALIKADEQKYDINQRFNSTGMFISRSHAGNEKNVFSQQQNPLSALEKIFLISACRSATDAGEINNSYPGAQIISINSIAVGLRTSIVTYYMLEGLAERAPTLLDVKESIRKHLRKGVEDYVFPNDPAYRVFSIVASSSPIIEREGSPVSPLTEGENNPASSAMDQNINRRQFLKGGVIAVASLLPLNKAGADMLEIFGISLVDIDSASDPRIKIVEDALKKLQPWEVELLRRYNINIRDVKNFQSRGRVQKREVLLNHEEHGDSFTTEGGFTIDAIIHEIGHVIYMIIMPEMLKDRWLPNFMTWAQRERLVSEVSREYERNKSYGLPGNIIKTSVDLPNDRLISYEKVYLGRKGDERYSWNPKYKTEGEFIYSETARNLDFRRRVEEFMGKIEKVTGNKIPYDRVKQAYMTYGEGSFMKQWYDINEKAEIEYSFDAYFFGKKPPSKGFASSYSQRGIHEEMAEIYMLMRLYPEKLKELVESDEFVRDKVKLMEGLLNELEKEYKKNPTGSSPIEKKESKKEPLQGVTSLISAELDINDIGLHREEWLNVLRQPGRWRKSVDFAGLFADRRLVVIGDTHHGFLGVKKGLVEHLEEIKAAGVTHICLEIRSNLKLDDIAEIVQGTWIPHRFLQLVQKAQSLGVQVVFMDLPAQERDASWSEERLYSERGIYMGKYISGLIKDNPEAKVLAVTGYGHIQDRQQIPFQLDNAELKYTLLAMVSEGQHGTVMGIEHPFLALSLPIAVAQIAKPTERYGFIDLTGLNTGVAGVIHFPRPQPDALTAQPIPALLSMQAETNNMASTQISDIQPIKEGQIRNPVRLNFSSNVQPNSQAWEKTNQEKILYCLAQLQGITDGQKLYLAALLFSYAQNTGSHNMGGSIVSIGFIPEGQFFEIETVDTFIYQFNPKADYGSLKQHHEVSLRTLQERFGFGDLLIRNISEIPSVAITNNPEKPLSIIKIIPLVLASITHPERTMVLWTLNEGPWLRVYYEDVREKGLAKGLAGVPFLAELTIEDFYLNKLENKFVEAKIGMETLIRVVGNLLWGTNGLHEFLEGDNSRLQKLWALMREKERMGKAAATRLYKVSSENNSYKGFVSQVDEAILSARKELRFLDQQQVDKLVTQLNTAITGFQQGLDIAIKLFSKYPELAQMQIHSNDGIKTAAEFLKEVSEALDHLEIIRNSIVEPSLLSAKNTDDSKLLNTSDSSLQEKVVSSAVDKKTPSTASPVMSTRTTESIREYVADLGYSDATASKFISLITRWQDRKGNPLIDLWRLRIEQARQQFQEKTISLEVLASIEAQTINELAQKIKGQMGLGEEFDLNEIVDFRNANCTGHTQLAYILANTLGLTAIPASVFEFGDRRLYLGEEHIIALIKLSDGRVIQLDSFAFHPISEPFALEQAYNDKNYYLEIKNPDNPLKIHRKIKLAGKNSLVADIYNHKGTNEPNPVAEIEYYEKALALDPAFVAAHCNLAIAYTKLGRYPEALVSMDMAISLLPDHDLSYYSRGNIHLRAGNITQAIEDHTHAISLNPEFVEAYYNRANLYLRLSDVTSDSVEKTNFLRKADADLSESITIITRKGWPERAELYLNRGVARLALNRRDEAAFDLKHSLELNPNVKAQVERIADIFRLSLSPDQGISSPIELTAQQLPAIAPLIFSELSSSPQKEPVSSAVEKIDPSLRSGLTSSVSEKTGGIDFRALPVVSSPINSVMLKLSPAQIKMLSSLDLDAEWAEIQNMLKAGIIPSNERVREYVASSCLRQSLGDQMGKVLGCIANILRMEEDRVTQTEPELEDMLVLIESGKPESELQLGLVQIQIPAREPQVITP